MVKTDNSFNLQQLLHFFVLILINFIQRRQEGVINK